MIQTIHTYSTAFVMLVFLKKHLVLPIIDESPQYIGTLLERSVYHVYVPVPAGATAVSIAGRVPGFRTRYILGHPEQLPFTRQAVYTERYYHTECLSHPQRKLRTRTILPYKTLISNNLGEKPLLSEYRADE
jgi:hypothetical protein